MVSRMITCRVCGKSYQACNSVRRGDAVFNWREFACSPQCGEKYFALIEESRKPKQEAPAKTDEDEIFEQESPDE